MQLLDFWIKLHTFDIICFLSVLRVCNASLQRSRLSILSEWKRYTSRAELGGRLVTITNSQSHAQRDADIGVDIDPSSSLAVLCQKPSLLRIQYALGGNDDLGSGRRSVEFGSWEVRLQALVLCVYRSPQCSQLLNSTRYSDHSTFNRVCSSSMSRSVALTVVYVERGRKTLRPQKLARA